MRLVHQLVQPVELAVELVALKTFGMALEVLQAALDHREGVALCSGGVCGGIVHPEVVAPAVLPVHVVVVRWHRQRRVYRSRQRLAVRPAPSALALAKNRSLWSRVHTRISLREASATDTAEYDGRRMKRAGADREIFNADPVAIVHEHAQGGSA